MIRTAILIVTILSSVLLICILVYSPVKKLYDLIRLGQEKQQEDQNTNDKEDDPKSALISSVIGKSKFKLSQPLPTATTPIVKEPDIGESISNFAPKENEELMDIDVPLEKEVIEDTIDEEQEAIELEELFGKDVSFASGIDINELGKLKHVIETPSAEIKEQRQVGRVLYENRETDMVEQMVSGSSNTASIISNLIDLHMTSYQEEQEHINEKEKLSDDIIDFDVNHFLGRK